MNGAFAMTEVPAIPHAMTPAEAYVKRMLAAGASAGEEGIEALSTLGATIRATIAALHTESPRVANCDAVAARLAALRDSLPEVAAPVLPGAEEAGTLELGEAELGDFIDPGLLETVVGEAAPGTEES